jgi:hypothetical protein
MRKHAFVLGFVAVAFAACAGSGGGGGGGPGFEGDSGTTDSGPTGKDAARMDAPRGHDGIAFDTRAADATCAAASFSAESAPAAMLFVLDASGTMGQSAGGSSTKWANAQQAIVTAMNLSVFDTVSLGLLTYPQTTKELAMCPLLHSLGVMVNCEVTGLAQVPLQIAGTDTSDTTGVRHDIYQALVDDAPTAGPGNGDPAYDALQTGITTLQAAKTSKRLMFFITDGGASCTSQDSPQRPAYKDGNGCLDWENPGNIVTMLGDAYASKTAPINTLVVGVKGADNSGPAANNPPYSIRLALSAYAAAGSPETVPAGCDGTYTETLTDPTVPCHFDLTTDPSFGTVLASDIEKIRDQLLGCSFVLPKPEAGSVDTTKVNVQYSTGGGKPIEIYKRASSKDTCDTGAGCWDYSGDTVELIGNACAAVEKSTSADVQILVGCETIVK